MSSHFSFPRINPAFADELKRRVREHFAATGRPTTGNWKLFTKSGILLTAAAVEYGLLVSGWLPVWIALPLCVLLGLNLAAIGFNVMHDGAHGSYSRRRWVNEMMAHSLNVMGGSVYLWKQKHNLLHHVYTNIEGLDDDIDIRPWIRTNPHQRRRWIHRFQHMYGFALYAFTYLAWVWVLDFDKYFKRKVGNVPIRRMSAADHLVFWGSKIFYLIAFILLPMFQVGFLPTLAGYLAVSLVCGWVISVVFQLAHVVRDTEFLPRPGDAGSAGQEWSIHQLATTANFSTRSALVAWFTGGLNFQVEHHLFPRISHVHYPEISVLVKEVCRRFGVHYIEYPSLFSALRSHTLQLKAAGQAKSA